MFKATNKKSNSNNKDLVEMSFKLSKKALLFGILTNNQLVYKKSLSITGICIRYHQGTLMG